MTPIQHEIVRQKTLAANSALTQALERSRYLCRKSFYREIENLILIAIGCAEIEILKDTPLIQKTCRRNHRSENMKRSEAMNRYLSDHEGSIVDLGRLIDAIKTDTSLINKGTVMEVIPLTRHAIRTLESAGYDIAHIRKHNESTSKLRNGLGKTIGRIVEVELALFSIYPDLDHFKGESKKLNS